MRKLLGYFFKRDQVVLLSAFGISLLACLISRANAAPEVTLFAAMAIYVAAVAGGIVVLARDYRAFCGDRSPFFAALPLTGRQVVGARFAYLGLLLLLTSLIGAFMGARLLVLFSAAIGGQLNFVIEQLKVMYSQPSGIALIGSLFLLNLGTQVALWLFAVSVGSERTLRRFSFGGPVLVYILTALGIGAIDTLLGALFPFGFVFEWGRGFFFGAIQPEQELFGLPLTIWIVSALCVALGLWRSAYSHNQKLSAY